MSPERSRSTPWPSVGAERDWVRALRRRFPAAGDEIVALGDDAAVLPRRGRDTVACCDPVVEGVHFESGTALGLVGKKAVNRNLSDLAAMGARPDWLLVSLVLPRTVAGDAGRRRQASLLGGIAKAARAANCTVAGGDVAVHDGPLVVTVTALGHLAARPLTRCGARPGDTLHVTGALGGSILGRHLTFDPPLDAGEALGRFRRTGACMDVSDGLVLDLATMLAASAEDHGCRLGADLDGRSVPIARAAHRLARETGRTPLEHALGDGEDHVLLFSVRPGRGRWPEAIPESSRSPIGVVVERPGVRLRGDDGGWVELDPRSGGFQHGL